MSKHRKSQTSLSGTAAAIEAARNLDPAELEKILADKKPASPEGERESTINALLAKAMELPGEQLAQFVVTQKKALLQLEILHIKRNVSSLTLDSQELDGLLLVLDKLPSEQKKDLTTRIQQAAVAAGLPQQQLQLFAQKLIRMGLHL